MNAHHFLSTADWSTRLLEETLDLAANLKAGRLRASVGGKTLGMLFFNPSLRTRTSFQVAMNQLEGHAVVLEVGGGVWDLESTDGAVMDGSKAEHVREAVPVLSRYVDALAVRSFAAGLSWQEDRLDPVLSAFANHATVPLINMESALWHPCQALADALTWRELGLRRGSRLVLSWAYHPRALPMAVPNSVVTMAAQAGLDLHVLRPPGFALAPEIMERACQLAAANGGRVQEGSDRNCLAGARVIYAKSWGSLGAYGQPERESSIRGQYRDWKITMDWMRAAGPSALFMHCLPVRRNVVVADEVLDSGRSVVIDQAENRLHVQKAVLARLLGAEIENLEAT